MQALRHAKTRLTVILRFQKESQFENPTVTILDLRKKVIPLNVWLTSTSIIQKSLRNLMHSWFWARRSLQKRIMHKCSENCSVYKQYVNCRFPTFPSCADILPTRFCGRGHFWERATKKMFQKPFLCKHLRTKTPRAKHRKHLTLQFPHSRSASTPRNRYSIIVV